LHFDFGTYRFPIPSAKTEFFEWTPIL